MPRPKQLKLGIDGKKIIEGTADEVNYTVVTKVIHGQEVKVKMYDNPYLETQCNREQTLYIKGRY